MNQKQSERQIRELLARYIKGECTVQEAALMEKWYEKVKGERFVVRLLSAADEERLVSELWKVIAEKEGESPAEEEPGEAEPDAADERGYRGLPRRIARYAAIWAGVLVMAGWALGYWYKHSVHSRQEITFKELSTGYQQTGKAVLPDSSVVWLNSATHLFYRTDFTEHREVRLSGEAFFQVAPDARHPFTVRAGNASTHVIGTAFNISAYPEAGQLRISLKSGKIGVEYESKSGKAMRELTPGKLFIFDKETGACEIVDQAPGEMDVWTGGRLLFYQTPMKEALAQIEARYGVHITYDNPLKNQTITARFENTALEKVLQYLSFGWELRCTRVGDTLHVFQEGH
jgi:ferric-dicitrate binding protein FerR (iron transport regulator)